MDYETGKVAQYECPESNGILDSGFCILHDKNYLEGGKKEKKAQVLKKLEARVMHSRSESRPLVCIGCYLPDVDIRGEFSKPVYFSESTFLGAVDFFGVRKILKMLFFY